MRQFSLVPGLLHIWRLSLHVLNQEPLPLGYPMGMPRLDLRQFLYPWDLDILSRELVLNCGNRGSRSFGKWSDLAKAINMIRKLENIAFSETGAGQVDVMLEIHRMAHRQFPWQMNDGAAVMMRAFKIYGTEAVNKVVVQQLGMSMRDYMVLGMAITGNFNKQFDGISTQEYSVLGVIKEVSEKFFSRIVTTTSELRSATIMQQNYNNDWTYAWNPLESRPLVSFDTYHPERLICPIPWYLLRRTSGGVFYDLVNSASFSNPFGNAFEDYVGDIIAAACNPDHFTVLDEEPYMIGSRKMHGVDWTLSDSTGHIFIEAKTKRLKMTSKTRSDPVTLDNDLKVMAQAVVQHYQNVDRCLQRLTRWKPNGLPHYLIILTLDDWYFFSPRVQEMLKKHVLHLLDEAGIGREILDTTPYTIASASEFEIISQVINQIGIRPVMEAVITPERRGWTLLPIATNMFPEQLAKIDRLLFRAEFVQLWENITGSGPWSH